MESLRGLSAASLRWESVRGDVPLRILPWNGEPMAELRWNQGIGAEGVVATTADGAWGFDRAGLLTKHVRIDPAAGMDATYEAAVWDGGGELTTTLGTSFGFRPANLMGTRWAFVDAHGRAWVTFLLEMRRILRTVQVVRIEPAGEGSDELPLLVTLGSWLAVLARRDQASGVGTG